jgi:hypothetical protein
MDEETSDAVRLIVSRLNFGTNTMRMVAQSDGVTDLRRNTMLGLLAQQVVELKGLLALTRINGI